MKRNRIMPLLLAAALLCSPAGAWDAEPWQQTTALTEELTLTEGVFAVEGSRQAEHYISYLPGGAVQPAICYGASLSEKLCFSEAEAQLRAEGKRVIAGVNGDYYVIASSIPVGILVRDGELLCSDGGNGAVGFLPDGSVCFGKPALQMRLDIGTERYVLNGLNKSQQGGGFYLYTSAFGKKTGVSGANRTVALRAESGARLATDGSWTLTVEANEMQSGAVPIPQDRLLLCLASDSDAWRRGGLEALRPGDQITLSVSSVGEQWSQCSQITGSLYKLITGGRVEPELERIDSSRAPRTAVGVRADGSVLFYTVDGRQSGYSLGLSLTETARRLLELGCVEAGALDGGGSTTLQAQQAGADGCALQNSPSMGREREVSTFLLLTTSNKGSGQAKTLSLRAASAAVLCGGEVQLTAGACDESGAPAPIEPLIWKTDMGRVEQDGLYHAPLQPGTAKLWAEAGSLSQSLELEIVETPDEIRLCHETTGGSVTSLRLSCGEQAELSAKAFWRLLEIQAKDRQFHWSCEGNAGVIDGEGHFTASATGGIGSVTVSAGERSMTVGVTVKAPIMCAADFEQVTAGQSSGLEWKGESSMDRVRYGSGSLRLDYDLCGGEASYPLELPLAAVSHYLSLWVYGDASGMELDLEQGGKETLLDRLDYRGWKLITVPCGVSGGVKALRLRGSGSGTIWLDQILLTDEDTPDIEPPILSLHSDGPLLFGSAADRVDGVLRAEQLRLEVDGQPLAFSYDPVTGELEALAEDSGLLRRVTLTACDLSGNRVSVSTEIPGESPSPFGDVTGHWAEACAGYLYGRGIISGKPAGDRLLFDPDGPMTRAELAVMLCRWKQLSPAAAEPISFADEAEIPAWAKESVQTAASLGLIQGEAMADGSLRFSPQLPVTRAHAATLLGRTLEGGRMGADLPFTDVEQIPDWAIAHVSTLRFMNVMQGFEDGSFRPQAPLTRAQAAKLLTAMS